MGYFSDREWSQIHLKHEIQSLNDIALKKLKEFIDKEFYTNVKNSNYVVNSRAIKKVSRKTIRVIKDKYKQSKD